MAVQTLLRYTVGGCLIFVVACTPRTEAPADKPAPAEPPVVQESPVKPKDTAPAATTGKWRVTIHVPEMTERLGLT